MRGISDTFSLRGAKKKNRSVMTGNRKSVIGWALYDWANSAFATTVMAAFFPLYFKAFWSAGTDPVVSTARLGMANSAAGIVIALAAPVLGAMADRGGARKRLLSFFAFLGIAMTFSLALIARGSWQTAVFVYVAANIGFTGGNIFYDSLLPSVAPPERSDAVSSLGFALGYLGGGLLFALNVMMTMKPDLFGIPDASAAVRLSFVTVSLWWLAFSLPLFFCVAEPSPAKERTLRRAVQEGFGQIRDTLRHVRQLRMIVLFLLAYWLYIDGVDTIIRMALDYGLSLGFETQDLIMALLITQFVGFPCALAFGWLGGRIGTKRSLFIAIAVYIAVTAWGSFIHAPCEFYILAALIGTVQGGIQALSRSYYARIIPPDRAAEYFGFYNMIGKFSVVIGPVIVGMSGLAARALGCQGDLASRVGIFSIIILFLAGGTILAFVDEEAGRRQARGNVGRTGSDDN